MDKFVLLARVSKLVSESMGKESGEMFYKYHHFDDTDTILDDAKVLLHDLLGPKVADQKIEEIKKEIS